MLTKVMDLAVLMGRLMVLLIMGTLVVSAADDATPIRRSPAFNDFAPVRHTSGISVWRASVAALMTANIMDVESSWGKRELNPALAGGLGTFGARGTMLKAGITGGVVALEFLVLRHGPSKRLERVLAVINFGDAGLTGATAARNWGIGGR